MATFSISAVARKAQATANGSTTQFAFSFSVNTEADVAVFVGTTLKTISTHYTVSITSSTGAGSITFTSGNTPTNGQIVTIMSKTALARSSVYTSGGTINATSLETDFDTNMMLFQQQDERLDRTLIAPVDDATSIDMTLPNKDARKGTVLGFNATSGNPEAGPSITAVQSLADVTTAINLLGTSDAVSDMNTLGTSTNVTNQNTLAGIASNITTVAGIASNVTAVAGDATDIGAVAGKATEIGLLGNSDTVADLALLGTSAVVEDLGLLANSTTIGNMAQLGTAAVVEDMGILGTSANVTAMSNVSGSIGNVNTVATNLSGITAFSAVYSSGGTDPSSNLNEGDLFFNTSSDALKVYDGSNWVAGVTAGSGFLPLAGGTMTGNLVYGDNVKATFGNSADLEIFHDGSNSFITDGGTGNLMMRAGDFTMQNPSGSETLFEAVRNGPVKLWYDHSNYSIPKLETTASGINVTGNVVVSGTVDGVDLQTLNTAVSANTAKTTNATHSGEVTGSGALTIADNVVDEANLKVSNSAVNGYMLTAQSGNTGGLTWAAAGGGGLEFIASADASDTAAIAFTGFDSSKYDNYVFMIANFLPATDGQWLRIRLSVDGGSNYLSASDSYLIAGTAAVSAGDSTYLSFGYSGMGSAAGEGMVGEIHINGPHLNAPTHVYNNGVITIQNGTLENYSTQYGNGKTKAATVVNAAQFSFTSGNIASGTITMYGMVNS